VSRRLVVDPIACDGRGVCAELLPGVVTLDDWGYPVVDGRPLPPELLAEVRRAVRLCPTLALRLERLAPGQDSSSSARSAALRTP